MATALLAGSLVLGLLHGCAVFRPDLDDAAARDLAGLAYPAESDRSDDLDIVITRDGDELIVINRSAEAYSNAYMWLNQEYVRPIVYLPVGSPQVLDLTGFVNGHAERFPVGGLLSPEKTRKVVLAELYQPPTRRGRHRGPGTRHRLLVRLNP